MYDSENAGTRGTIILYSMSDPTLRGTERCSQMPLLSIGWFGAAVCVRATTLLRVKKRHVVSSAALRLT